MSVDDISMQAISKQSALFDPELATASDVMMAICCVATRYALNPTLDLAMLALRLAGNLSATEVAKSEKIAEVADMLIKQWNSVLIAHQEIEASVMPQHDLLQ